MNDVEGDGRRIEDNRDPPGQKCVYIHPGDSAKETYRLSTFQQFPRTCPIDPQQFASNGFFYTGYRDRVKCFSCGQSSDNWTPIDDITDGRWHQHNCNFFHGTDNTNIPIGVLFPNTALQHRLFNSSNMQESTSRQHGRAAEIPQPIATSLPSVVVVQNALQSSSSGRQHAPDNEAQRLTTFPCHRPVNPHMRSAQSRMQTFIDNIGTWPGHRIRASLRAITDAGLYYLGERDRVKCWYCNGGLQNWERDDLPWEEHAKWFPLCEFVLQQKGVAFVDEIVTKSPGISRPSLSNAATAAEVRIIARKINFRPNGIHQAICASNGPSGPTIVDPREELRRRDIEVDRHMTSSEVVGKAKSMGFDEMLIRETLKRQFEEKKAMFSGLEELIESLLANESSMMRENTPASLSSSSNTPGSNPVDEMKRLEQSKKCRVCRGEDSCILLLPCGHLACCVNCGPSVTDCPICKERVTDKVRSYLS